MATNYPKTPPGRELAVWAEALYLINLLLLPGIAFLVLSMMFWRNRDANTPPLANNHLRQAFFASLWAGGLLVIVSILLLVFGDYQSVNTWMVIILYFVSCHAVLVLFGAWGLAKALAGQHYVYPLLGHWVER